MMEALAQLLAHAFGIFGLLGSGSIKFRLNEASEHLTIALRRFAHLGDVRIKLFRKTIDGGLCRIETLLLTVAHFGERRY